MTTPDRDQPDDSRPFLTAGRARWLQGETSRWVADGLINPAARAQILASYDVESAGRRGLLALMLLGALMFSIGALLLIGYNWDRIPVNAKVAIAVGSVVLAFAASSVAFARRHAIAGEILSLIGVLLYGNAIWLIAQVLHMSGSVPDAFMWWAIGGIAVAALVRSEIVGVGAAILVGVWLLDAGFTVDRPVAMFVAVWACTVGLGYWFRSQVIIAFAVGALAVWVTVVSPHQHPAVVSIGSAALSACMCYAVGSWHRGDNPLGRAWQRSALAVLAIAFISLLMTDTHESNAIAHVRWGMLAVPLVAAVMTTSTGIWLATIRANARESKDSTFADVAIMLTGATVMLWLGAIAAGIGGGQIWTRLCTIAFSLLALSLCVSLIHKALVRDTGLDLGFGVLFGLVFLFVRWASLVDSMLWSGVMLLVASASLFVVARLWRDRSRPAALAGAA